MGMAGIFVNGPQPFYQSFIPLPQEGSTWNLSNTRPAASEEKLFVFLNIFSHTNVWSPYKCQMHREANLTSLLKGQTSM